MAGVVVSAVPLADATPPGCSPMKETDATDLVGHQLSKQGLGPAGLTWWTSWDWS